MFRSLVFVSAALAPLAPLCAQEWSASLPLEEAVPPAPPIVVTASRQPVLAPLVAGSLTVVEEPLIEALDLPQAVDLLRLAPGTSVSRSGPVGSQTQVRIRGAEANHTLVFVDGIEANDPGSSNEFRWEYLPAAGLEQVELLRGPASALWGSEALGGVVAVTSYAPSVREEGFGSAQYGSFDTYDFAGGVRGGSGDAAMSLSGSYYETDGIDSFAGGPLERDGFDNLAVTGKAQLAPDERGELGLVLRYADSRTEFDGFDPASFQRADTADASENEQFAARGYGALALLDGRWTHRIEGSWLGTRNRNFRGGLALNGVEASSFRLFYQSGLELEAAGGAAQPHRGGRTPDAGLPRPRQRVFRRHRSGPPARQGLADRRVQARIGPTLGRRERAP